MRRSTKNVIQQAILTTLMLSGVVAAVTIAPNALQVLDMIGKSIDAHQRNKPKVALSRSLKNLIAKGYIEFTSKRKDYLQLTSKGRKKFYEIRLQSINVPIPKKWDRKWRIIIFDIQEVRKKDRDRLRRTLMRIGFYKLQNSVWVFPYECEEIIGLLKTGFNIGKDVLYITADKIENDTILIKYFDL